MASKKKKRYGETASEQRYSKFVANRQKDEEEDNSTSRFGRFLANDYDDYKMSNRAGKPVISDTSNISTTTVHGGHGGKFEDTKSTVSTNKMTQSEFKRRGGATVGGKKYTDYEEYTKAVPVVNPTVKRGQSNALPMSRFEEPASKALMDYLEYRRENNKKADEKRNSPEFKEAKTKKYQNDYQKLTNEDKKKLDDYNTFTGAGKKVDDFISYVAGSDIYARRQADNNENISKIKKYFAKKGYTEDEFINFADYQRRETNAIEAEQRRQDYQSAVDWAVENNHPALATIMTSPVTAAAADVMSWGTSIPDAIDNYRRRKQIEATGANYLGADVNSPYQQYGQIRDVYKEDALKDASNAYKQVYNTAESILTSLATRYVAASVGGALGAAGVGTQAARAVGSAVGGSMLGVQAYNDTLIELENKGIDEKRAQATAVAAGVSEMLFESLSIELLPVFEQMPIGDLVRNRAFKDLVKVAASNMTKGAITNASEEFFTEVGNIVAESLILGADSDFQKARQNYADRGDPHPTLSATGEMLSTRGLEAAKGGFIQGLVMGGAANAYGLTQKGAYDSYVANQAGREIAVKGAGEETLAAADAAGGNVQGYAKHLIDKRGGQENLTVKDYGKIAVQTRRAEQNNEYTAQRVDNVRNEFAKKRKGTKSAEEYNTNIDDEAHYRLTNPTITVDGERVKINAGNLDNNSIRDKNGTVNKATIFTGEKGELSVNTADERTVKLTDAIIDSANNETARELMRAAVDNDLGADAANALINSYDGMTSPRAHTEAFMHLYNQAKLGTDLHITQGARGNTELDRAEFTVDQLSDIVKAAQNDREYKPGTLTELDTGKKGKFEKVQRDIIRKIAEATKKEVVIVDNLFSKIYDAEGNEVYRFYNGEALTGDNRIILSANAQKGLLLSYLGHEMGHMMKAEDAASFAKFAEIVQSQYGKTWDNEKAKFMKLGYLEAEVEDEIVCNAFFDAFAKSENLREIFGTKDALAIKAFNLLDKISKSYDNALKRYMGEIGRNGELKHSDIVKLQSDKKVLDGAVAAMKDYVNAIQNGETKAPAEAGERYSIAKDINGETFVKVDEDIFASNPKKASQIIAETIKNKWNNIFEVNGQKFRINADTNSEWRKSESARAIEAKEPVKYADKLKAINNADEIVAAARDWINEEKSHERDDYSSFARGFVNFKAGNNGYAADVIVGLKDDGSATFYDLVEIYEKNITEAPVSKVTQETPIQTHNASVGKKNITAPSNSQEKTSINDSDGNELSEGQIKFFKNSQVRDNEGNLKPAYHGTGRADRVGNVFKPERATSGPMAFFTDSEEIAKGYSKDKRDTSIAYDTDYDSYETQFRTNLNGKYVKDIPIYKAWGYLPIDARARIAQKAKHVRIDYDGDGSIIYDPDATEANGGWSWQVQSFKGDILKALNEQWLNSGNLFNEEQLYLDVLEKAGVNEEFEKLGWDLPRYMDPNYREEAVYKVYLNITNPFDAVNDVTEDFIEKYLEWYDAQPEGKYDTESMGADLWDKNSITAEEFAERMRKDLASEKFTHAWTSIPDSMTDYLKSLGYDGIKDIGGKFTDITHTVWIPFNSNQIKRTDNLNPTKENDDIRYSVNDEELDLQSIESEINNAGLNLTSKDNNKNNLRVKAWLADNYPGYKFTFKNDNDKGYVSISKVQTNAEVEEEYAQRAERYKNEAETRRKRENFFKTYGKSNHIQDLEAKIENRLNTDFPNASLEHSKSTVGSLSFYITDYNDEADEGITIKVSDHNTAGQEFYNPGTHFINLKEVTSVDDLYSRIKNLMSQSEKRSIAYDISAEEYEGDRFLDTATPDEIKRIVDEVDRRVQSKPYIADREEQQEIFGVLDEIQRLKDEIMQIGSGKENRTAAEFTGNEELINTRYTSKNNLGEATVTSKGHKQTIDKQKAVALVNRLKKKYSYAYHPLSTENSEETADKLVALYEEMQNSSDIAWEDMYEKAREIAIDVVRFTKWYKKKEYAYGLKRNLQYVSSRYNNPYGDYAPTAVYGTGEFELSEGGEELIVPLINDILTEFYEIPVSNAGAIKDANKIVPYKNQVKALKLRINQMQKEAAKNIQIEVNRQRLADDIYYQRRIKEIREDRDQKLIAQKEAFKASRAKQKESKQVSDYKYKIQKTYDSLSNELLKPNAKRYVPEGLVRMVSDVLSGMSDTLQTPEYYTEGAREGQAIKSHIARNKKLADLKVSYDALKNDDRYSSIHDPVISDMLQVVSENTAGKTINEMNSEELGQVYTALKAIDHTVRKAAKVEIAGREADAFKVADRTIDQLKDVKKKKINTFTKFWYEQLNSYSFFRQLSGYTDGGWMDVNEMLNNGQLQQTSIKAEVTDAFRELTSDKRARELMDTKKLVDVGLRDAQGNSIPITRGMMISLYMHLQNEQNKRHIERGGLSIPDIERYYKGDREAYGTGIARAAGVSAELAYINKQISSAREDLKVRAATGGNTLELNAKIDDLQARYDAAIEKADAMSENLLFNISKQLTDYDRAWIDKAQWLFDEYSKDKLNEATMRMYGFRKANVDKYMPIRTDETERMPTFEGVKRDVSLENAGFMKERVKGASNAIYLEDIVDVIQRQMNNVATYAGLAPAVKDFEKIYGKSKLSTDGDAVVKTSVQGAVRNTFGNYGMKYIHDLVTDLQGGRRREASWLSSLRGNAYQAALTLNLRVAMAQAGSYPTAAAELGWKPLGKALLRGGEKNAPLSKADRELIAKYSPLLANRLNGGNSTVDINNIKTIYSRSAQGLNSKILHKTALATDWIAKVDAATVGRLWYASQYYVDEKNPSLTKGSDDYYKEVAKVFNRVVERTQPSYTTMQRSALLRNPNEAQKFFTMYMTQRAQNFNLLYDSAMELNAKREGAKNGTVSQEELKESKSNFGRVVSSQLAAGLTLSAMKIIADAIQHSMKGYRDDDDDEVKLEKIMEKLGTTWLESEMSNIFLGSEIYSLASSLITKEPYYGISVNVVGTLGDFTEDISNLATNPSEKAAIKAAKDAGTLLGIPASQIQKWTNMAKYWYQDIVDGGGIYSNYEGEEGTKQKVHKMVDAYLAGDVPQYRTRSDMLKDTSDSSVKSAITSYLQDAYIAGELDEIQVRRVFKNVYGKSDSEINKKLEEFRNGTYEKKESKKWGEG